MAGVVNSKSFDASLAARVLKLEKRLAKLQTAQPGKLKFASLALTQTAFKFPASSAQQLTGTIAVPTFATSVAFTASGYARANNETVSTQILQVYVTIAELSVLSSVSDTYIPMAQLETQNAVVSGTYPVTGGSTLTLTAAALFPGSTTANAANIIGLNALAIFQY